MAKAQSENIPIGNGQSVALTRPDGIDDKTWGELKQYLQSNPQMTMSMQKAIKDVTTNPRKMAEFKEMVHSVNNFSSSNAATVEKLKKDPELAAKFAEMEKGGLETILKYYNDEKFLRSLSAKAGGAPISLFDAIKTENTDAVRRILASGVNANSVDEKGISALHYAVGYNNSAAMGLLMEKGGNVYCVDPAQNTLLHYAAGYGCADAVDYLIKVGLNINQINRDGQTPLHLATKNSHPSTMSALRAAGAHL